MYLAMVMIKKGYRKDAEMLSQCCRKVQGRLGKGWVLGCVDA
jgi:hypothetical protein